MDQIKTALLLVDLQKEEGTSEIAGMINILDKASSLSKMCRKKGIPVIYTRHINRGDGIALANKAPVNEQGQPLYYHSNTETIEIADEVKPEQQDIIIDKYQNSRLLKSNRE